MAVTSTWRPLRSGGPLVLAALAAAGVCASGRAPQSAAIETLRPVSGLPARVMASFDDPRGFVETGTGDALVLDAGAQALYRVAPNASRADRVVSVGLADGHIFRPTALTLGPADLVAIADQPNAYDRVQYFDADGRRVGGFYVPHVPQDRLRVGPVVLNGVGSLQFGRQSFFFNLPDTGALLTEADTDGRPIRSFGTLRPTERDADLPLVRALNTGVPLIDPTGGFYFVFQTGVPMFRKYNAQGASSSSGTSRAPNSTRSLAPSPRPGPRGLEAPMARRPTCRPRCERRPSTRRGGSG